MRGKHNTVTLKIRRHMMNFQELLIALSKAHGVKAVLSLVCGYVALLILPIAHFLVIGILLVVCDWITGIWAAIKRREKITSKGLRRTIEKTLLYSLAIVLVLIVENAFFGSRFIVASVAMYISIVELFSNLENISTITGRNIIGVVRTLIYTRFPFIKKLMKNEQRDQ